MKSFQVVDSLLFDLDGTLTDLGTRWWMPFFRAIDKMKPDLDPKVKQKALETILTRVMQTEMGRNKLLKISMFLKAKKDTKMTFRDIIKAEEIAVTHKILEISSNYTH